MRYKTLIIGSGYAALGYALEQGNTLICEESELCDTAFCLPLSDFGRWGYNPVTEQGRALLAHFESAGIVRDGYPNTGALECGFCGFAIERGVKIRLKTRVISTTLADGRLYNVRMISGAGIEQICAERVIDMRLCGSKRTLTALFTTDSPERDLTQLKAAFPDGDIEPAFYGGRYALRLPADHGDYINAKRELYARWSSAAHGAQLLYTAPALAVRLEIKCDVPGDSCYADPIAALEAGIFYAREQKGASK